MMERWWLERSSWKEWFTCWWIFQWIPQNTYENPRKLKVVTFLFLDLTKTASQHLKKPNIQSFSDRCFFSCQYFICIFWILVLQLGYLWIGWFQGPRFFLRKLSHSSPKLRGKIKNNKLPTVLRCVCCSIHKNPWIILESRQIIAPSTKKTESLTKTTQEIFMKHEQVGADKGYNIFEISCKPIQPKVYLQTPSCSKFTQQKNPNKEPFHLSISSPPKKKGLGISPPPQNTTKNNQFDSPVFSTSAKVQEPMSWLHVEVTWDEHKTNLFETKKCSKNTWKNGNKKQPTERNVFF